MFALPLPYSLPFRQCLSLLHPLPLVLLHHALSYVVLSPLPPAVLQGYVLRCYGGEQPLVIKAKFPHARLVQYVMTTECGNCALVQRM
jgi:hypothetical protein